MRTVENVSQDLERPEADESTEIAVPEEDAVAVEHDPLAEFGIAIPDDTPVLPAERTLEFGGTVNFVLDVARIDRAEAFYHDLFELDVVCRAWRNDDGFWEVTTEEIDWASLLIDGDYPELVVLRRPGWTIVLHGMGRGQILKSPKIGDAEVPVPIETLRRIRARVLIKAYTVVEDRPERFAFRDPYAVVWTLVLDDTASTPE